MKGKGYRVGNGAVKHQNKRKLLEACALQRDNLFKDVNLLSRDTSLSFASEEL